MASLILCFDPWHGLKTPAPALYPEWGDTFRHYPGPLDGQQVLEIAAAMEESRGLPALWLLATPAQSDAELDEAIQDIKTVLKTGGAMAEPYRVIWRMPHRLDTMEAPTSLSPGVCVDLVLDGNLQDDPADWARLFLLPLALRFLMEQALFLTAEARGNLAGLELRTDRKTLASALQALQSSLADAASHARHQLDELDVRESGEKFFATELPGCAEAIQPYEPHPPGFGYFYKATADERRAADWINGETEQIIQRWSEFGRRIGDWRQDRLRNLTRQLPDQYHQGQTPMALQARFLADLQALPPNVEGEAFSLKAAKQAKALKDKHTDDLVRAVRRRPQRRLFFGYSLLLAVLAVWFSAFGAHIPAKAAAYPWAWPVASFISLSAAFLLLLMFARRETQSALRRATLALDDFFRQASDAGETLKNRASQMITTVLLNRNLEIVEREIRGQVTERGQWEYHLARLANHLDAFNARQAERLDALEDGGLDFAPSQPESANRAYWWRNPLQQPAQLVTGQDRRRLAEDREGRYAGVAEIIIRIRGSS